MNELIWRDEKYFERRYLIKTLQINLIHKYIDSLDKYADELMPFKELIEQVNTDLSYMQDIVDKYK